MKRKLAALALSYLFASAQVAAAAPLPSRARPAGRDGDDLQRQSRPGEGRARDPAAGRHPRGAVHGRGGADRSHHRASRARSPIPRVSASSSRTTSTTCSRARSSWRSTSAARCGSTAPTAPITRPPCSRTNGPVYEINGQIHLGHRGRVVLPALPDNLVSKPTLAWLLRNQVGSAAARGGLVSHRRHHLEGGLRDGGQRG